MSTITVSAGVRFAGRSADAASTGVRRRQAPTTRSHPAVDRCATRAHPAAQGVRLTRRGRLLFSTLALLVLVVSAVLLTGGPSALAGTGRGGQPVADRVTVQPGETLWTIAQRVAPGADPRETIQEILDLNGLRTADVQAGTALVVP